MHTVLESLDAKPGEPDFWLYADDRNFETARAVARQLALAGATWGCLHIPGDEIDSRGMWGAGWRVRPEQEIVNPPYQVAT